MRDAARCVPHTIVVVMAATARRKHRTLIHLPAAGRRWAVPAAKSPASFMESTLTPSHFGRRELHMTKKRTIKVDYLARVEGEGGIEVTTSNGAVTDVKLRIFEPPRFFEALLRGRDCREAPD